VKDLLIRKLIVTIFTSLIFSAGLLIISSFEHPNTEFTLGGYFFGLIGFMLIYTLYGGLFILTYGNVVSIILELSMKKWVKESKFYLILYILLHGLFGSLIGLVDGDNWSLAPLGGSAALLYGLIDVWIDYRFENDKGISLLPKAVFGLLIFATLIGLISF
jgi:hypothetical protein